MTPQAPTPPGPGTTRTSLRERMAAANGAGASNPLTETTATGFSADLPGSAFHIDQTGRVALAEAAAPIATTFDVSGPAGLIDVETARGHHLFLTTDEVDPSEVEALAVSVWDDAAWVGAGYLRLTSGAHLVGPWRIDAARRTDLDTPAPLTNAWILHCPASRVAAPADQTLHGEWARAFPDGMPTGLEYRVLRVLHQMARRLAGGLRICGSGRILEPDPDSAVNLSVYSPRWIAPEDLLRALAPDFPRARDASAIPARVPGAREARSQEQAVARLREGLGPVRPDLSTRIARARAEAAARPATPQVVEGYAIISPVGNRSDMVVEVRPVPRPPQVLRWESWTTGTIVEYQVKWLPGGSMEVPLTGVTRTARLERLRSLEGIERATGIIVALAGGSVVDEDGFLVALDQES
ncbi:hypothetical protein M3T53_07040 [Actinomyces sp. B33]|uniref:hypothetical protein n=1 Tax=Actinomyces sp. B33 TaxID=2942131 RepID=UPI00233FE305|nr:hypothetical protein [Actinomyces sp. B33]MDC4233462.1 hypothetical protein [Actinomyces sp. B33]